MIGTELIKIGVAKTSSKDIRVANFYAYTC
jgi:hypothetical protein